MIADRHAVAQTIAEGSAPLRIVGDAFFFIEPASDVVKDEKPDGDDPRHWSIARRLSFDFIAEEVGKAPHDSLLLDVGMGNAQFKEVYSKMKVIGADHYPYPDVRVVCDFTRPLPFKDDTFDVIMASNVLEHLPNPQSVFSEYHRVLRPGGRLIVAVPFLLGVHQAPYDFYRYTQFALGHLAEDAGLAVERISILGTGYDTYRHLQQKFFSLILDSKAKQKSSLGKLVIWSLAKCMWIIQSILNTIFSPMFARVEDTMKLPLMYGAVFIKK